LAEFPREYLTPTPHACESLLRRQVLDSWFPRSLDLEAGGFRCDFDRAWVDCGPHEKLLEFQARQTLLVAEASQHYPAEAGLRQAAAHGFEYLRAQMWDKEYGGWFHRLDRRGRPLEACTKHAHGTAYTIQACVAVYEATGEPAALELARSGFEWLETCAHDPVNGGYYGFLQRDGAIISDRSQCPWGADSDTIGTPIGYKDLNVQSDLLEAFVFLYRATRDPKVGSRLAELVEIACDKTHGPGGNLQYFWAPDWTAVPHLPRVGNACQTAFRLLMARELVGGRRKLEVVACKLTDELLRNSRDRRRGGFLYITPGTDRCPTDREGEPDHLKAWWVQFEALKSLLAVSRSNGDNASYRREFEAQWSYVLNHVIDWRYGGTYAVPLDRLPGALSRLEPAVAPARFTRKGNAWKDGSHEGRALMECLLLLGSEVAPAGSSTPHFAGVHSALRSA